MEVLEVNCVKKEPDWERSVAEQAQQTLLEGLYVDHEVKHELVLGPELLQGEQRHPATYTVEVTVKIEDGETCGEEVIPNSMKSNNIVIKPIFTNNNQKSIEENTANFDVHYLSHKDLFTLKNCFVKIERLVLHKEQYTCKICKKTYSQKSNLTYHMRIHEESESTKKEISHETIECNTRKKVTVKDSTLKRLPFAANITHSKKQTEKKPHKCEVCGKQFRLKALLTNHYRIHTGETPYSCTICNRRFTEVANLKRHERTHSGERPFSCEICKKQFALKCNLMLHIRTHTKEKPYSCDFCNKQFLHTSDLKRQTNTCS